MPLYATIGHLINKTVLKNTTNSDCKRVQNIDFILLERLMLVLFEWSYFKRLFNAGGTQYKQVMFGTSSDVDTTAQN